MKINKKKIDKAILDIKRLQAKYSDIETNIVYHDLDEALKDLGWRYAELLGKGRMKYEKEL